MVRPSRRTPCPATQLYSLQDRSCPTTPAEIPVPREAVVGAPTAPAPAPQPPTPVESGKMTLPRFRLALVAFVAVGIVVVALVAAFAHFVP